MIRFTGGGVGGGGWGGEGGHSVSRFGLAVRR